MPGSQADARVLEGLSRMPELRILNLDAVKAGNMPSELQLPRLAMLSWRDAGGPLLPFNLQSIESAAVLDMSSRGRPEEALERLPDNLQACLLRYCLQCQCWQATMASCLAVIAQKTGLRSIYMSLLPCSALQCRMKNARRTDEGLHVPCPAGDECSDRI